MINLYIHINLHCCTRQTAFFFFSFLLCSLHFEHWLWTLHVEKKEEHNVYENWWNFMKTGDNIERNGLYVRASAQARSRSRSKHKTLWHAHCHYGAFPIHHLLFTLQIYTFIRASNKLKRNYYIFVSNQRYKLSINESWKY